MYIEFSLDIFILIYVNILFSTCTIEFSLEYLLGVNGKIPHFLRIRYFVSYDIWYFT